MGKLIAGLSLYFMLMFLGAIAYAGTVEEYSADMVSLPDGKVMQKMYVTLEKIRFDAYDQAGQLEIISILHLDQGKMYVLQPDDKIYFETTVDKEFTSLETLAEGMLGAKFDISREKQGEEGVSGYAAEKFKVTTTVNIMEPKMTIIHTEWLAPEFAPLPVRTETSQDRRVTEMRNIKIGEQDSALFDIPAEYKAINTEDLKNMVQAGQ